MNKKTLDITINIPQETLFNDFIELNKEKLLTFYTQQQTALFIIILLQHEMTRDMSPCNKRIVDAIKQISKYFNVCDEDTWSLKFPNR